jgi:hypothetical protein
MSFTDVQDVVYTMGFKLAMAALNPTYTFDPADPQNPPIPVIQDQQDESAPSGLYIAIQGSPTIEPFGTPYIEAQDGTDTRGLVQTYKATIIFWEVNGNGSSLVAIRESTYLTAMQDLLASEAAMILDTGTIDDVSFKVDNTWKRQSRMAMNLSVASRITETLSTIVTADTTKV